MNKSGKLSKELFEKTWEDVFNNQKTKRRQYKVFVFFPTDQSAIEFSTQWNSVLTESLKNHKSE